MMVSSAVHNRPLDDGDIDFEDEGDICRFCRSGVSPGLLFIILVYPCE